MANYVKTCKYVGQVLQPPSNCHAMLDTVLLEGAVESRGHPPMWGCPSHVFFLCMGQLNALDIPCGLDDPTPCVLIIVWLT